MTEPLTPLTAFMVGLLSSGHCLGMCGGISAALGMSVPLGEGFAWRRTTYLLGYNFGRIASYAVAGAVVALLGSVTSAVIPDASQVLRTLAGLLLVLMGLYVMGISHLLVATETLGQPLWRLLRGYAERLLPVTSPTSAVFAGMIWGWLPCGLVYASLSWAATQ